MKPRTFEIMPRDPDATGLHFQSSIYEPIDDGRAHNLICEVYTMAEAEHIKRCLNTHGDLLSVCEALIISWYGSKDLRDRARAAIAKARGTE